MTSSCAPGSAGAIASGSAPSVNKFKRSCANRSEVSRDEATGKVPAEPEAGFRDGRSYASLIKETLAGIDNQQVNTEVNGSVDVVCCTAPGIDETSDGCAVNANEPTPTEIDALLADCITDREIEEAAKAADEILGNDFLSGTTATFGIEEALLGLKPLKVPARSFNALAATPEGVAAALTNDHHSLCDGSWKSLKNELAKAHEKIACTLHEPMNRLRVCAVRRRRRDEEQTPNDNENLPETIANMHSQPASDVVLDSIGDDENNEPGALHADANARVVNAENHAAEQNAAVAAANQRLAALEAEIYTLRAAQGIPSLGEAAGTSYVAQANLALASMNPAAPLTQDDNAAPANDTVLAAEDGEVPNVMRSHIPPASTAPTTNMNPLREALEHAHEERTATLLARFGESLAASLSGHVQHTVQTQMVRPSTGVRPSEIGLSEFSGASSKMATVIEPEFYPRLLLWLEESEHLLRNSGLSTVQQIRTLFANLTGAARKQFTTRWRNLDFSTMTMADAKEKVFALVPNHQTHFSRAAMDMTFTPENLASDLDRFALYASHGDLPVNGHHFWYRMIQEKLLEACPDLFRLAAEHFGKRIEFQPHMNFNTMIEQFMDIVLAVQTELKAQLLGHKRVYSGTPRNENPKKPKTSPNDRGLDKTPKKTPDLNDDFNLARQVGMCFGCGAVYPSAGNGKRFDKNAHDSVCKKKFAKGVVTDEFASAIAKWRKYVSEGKSIAEIKRLADAARPKSK
jgi:hypothetical protein